ncbi:hypothetical protein EMCRGX_G022766 [Ephydatia muelleri]
MNHVAISLLRMCGGYCKLVHLARTTPTILCEDSLKFFDEEVRLCLSSCVAIDVPDPQWQQAQLSPKRGGLGLRSLSLHSCAAFISSLASLEMGNPDNIHLQQAILRFNARVSPQDSITMESVLNSPPQQKSLSQMLDSFAFHSLLSSASPVNKARMLSVSSPHASSWITAIPSTRLKMHLESAEFQMAIRWWLGLKTSDASPCPFCPDLVLDPLGHHATSCRHGGDVVIRHNHLRDIVADFCRQAHLSVRVEAGYGLSSDHSNTRPADVLVQGWDRGSPAALDITVTSPLTPATLRDASSTAGAAAYAAECRKHTANDAKCQELGWACIPLAVETFGNWGMEAQGVFPRLASALGMHQGTSKSWALHTIYSRLNMSLVRSVARSILDETKRSNVPYFEILGAPIGDLVFCANFVAQKQSEASKLLQQLEAVGSIGPQVALLLLRQYCRLVHLSRNTPTPLVKEAFALISSGTKVVVGYPGGSRLKLPSLPSFVLDDFGHHSLSYFCQHACLGPCLEMGCGPGYTNSQSRPADVLVPNWDLGKPAAFDLSVTSHYIQVFC